MNPLLEQHRAAFNALEREIHQLLADINPKDKQLMNLARMEVLRRFEAALSDARFEMGVTVIDPQEKVIVLDKDVMRDLTEPVIVDNELERVGV